MHNIFKNQPESGSLFSTDFMEIYCTRPDCIENGFSIQYRLVQYTSILCIVLYNNLLILHEHRFKQVMNSIHFRYIRATSGSLDKLIRYMKMQNDLDIFFWPTYLIYEIYAYIHCHIQCT
jgi:hypothetical protein